MTRPLGSADRLRPPTARARLGRFGSTTGRLVATAGLVAALVALAVGCGSDHARQDAVVKSKIAKQLELTPAQSDCLWGYLTRELDRKVIDQIPSSGLAAIPAENWGAYVEGTLTCVLYQQLVHDGRTPRAGG